MVRGLVGVLRRGRDGEACRLAFNAILINREPQPRSFCLTD